MPTALVTLLLLAAITASAQTTQSVIGQPQLGGTITGVVTNNNGDQIEGATLLLSDHVRERMKQFVRWAANRFTWPVSDSRAPWGNRCLCGEDRWRGTGLLPWKTPRPST
jgi:hypothetical protein